MLQRWRYRRRYRKHPKVIVYDTVQGMRVDLYRGKRSGWETWIDSHDFSNGESEVKV